MRIETLAMMNNKTVSNYQDRGALKTVERALDNTLRLDTWLDEVFFTDIQSKGILIAFHQDYRNYADLRIEESALSHGDFDN